VTASHCAIHRERPAVETLGARSYCAECRDARLGATQRLELRAIPSDCFASHLGAGRWLAFQRGAPAHWLAHQLGVRARPERPACAAGFAVERADLLAGRSRVSGEPPRAGDLWVDLDAEGCGLVCRSQRDETRGFAISIRHLCATPARELHSDFYLDLAARGTFFR
jgi:hypothetical protein